MEVTALCIRLLMNVLFLLCDQKVDSVSLRVEPNKLQFFQYDNVTFHCEGTYGWYGWKVAHKVKKDLPCQPTTESYCVIKDIYPEEGGEYWCEDGNGKRSDSINITVTDGSVILESPALPVTEGDVVTLRCRNKDTSSDLLTGFYKDGVLIRNSSTGEINICRVSKFDEGLYKCKTSDGGESAVSRLTVREHRWEEEDGKKNKSANITVTEPHTETPPCSDDMFFIFRNIIPVVLMAPLLLLLGLLHCGNLRGSCSRCVM